MELMISFCELTFILATVAPRMGKYRLLYAVNVLVYDTSWRLSLVYLPCTKLLCTNQPTCWLENTNATFTQPEYQNLKIENEN